MDLVHAALRAERGFVGVQCGIMDPYAVGLAREGRSCGSTARTRRSEYLPFGGGELSIAVADTLVRRELAQGRSTSAWSSADGVRASPTAQAGRDVPARHPLRDAPTPPARELDPIVARRAQHVIREVERTFAARDALRAATRAASDVEMFRAHESLRDLFEVSVPELDRLVESAAACRGFSARA